MSPQRIVLVAGIIVGAVLFVFMVAGGVETVASISSIQPADQERFDNCYTHIQRARCSPPMEFSVGECMMYERSHYARLRDSDERIRWLRRVGCPVS